MFHRCEDINTFNLNRKSSKMSLMSSQSEIDNRLQSRGSVSKIFVPNLSRLKRKSSNVSQSSQVSQNSNNSANQNTNNVCLPTIGVLDYLSVLIPVSTPPSTTPSLRPYLHPYIQPLSTTPLYTPLYAPIYDHSLNPYTPRNTQKYSVTDFKDFNVTLLNQKMKRRSLNNVSDLCANAAKEMGKELFSTMEPSDREFKLNEMVPTPPTPLFC